MILARVVFSKNRIMNYGRRHEEDYKAELGMQDTEHTTQNSELSASLSHILNP